MKEAMLLSINVLLLLLINRNRLFHPPPAHDHRRGQGRLRVNGYTHCLYTQREIVDSHN
jgi:hypothetical protein